MARKLKGKATKELKGLEKRKRFKQWDEAKELWCKILPLLLVVITVLIGYFSYKILDK